MSIVQPLPLASNAASPSGSALGHAIALPNGRFQAALLVPDVHCAGCISRIEGRLGRMDDVETARVNLSTKCLNLVWAGPRERMAEFIAAVEELGFNARAYTPDLASDVERARQNEWLKALAVAFFANSNVMMLSWAVWAGHFGAMGDATRALFHWISALIAVPAVLYAGRPFFRSAFQALSHRTTNMDVPIAAGVVITTAMSLSETIRGGPHVYFDGALSLLFVLLLGRTLDAHLRRRARSGVETLAAMLRQPVALKTSGGAIEWVQPAVIVPGDRVLVGMGERIGIDGIVVEGDTTIDTALINGESLPRRAARGSEVHAGMINVGQPIVVQSLVNGDKSTLSEMVRLMEAAEQRKGRYVAFADRVVGYYTPVVHALAFLTFIGWLLLADSGWSIALVHAVSVLIIACPCALGLAVPVTQIVATTRAMKAGILLKSETALERLSAVDQVVFDKTGTLTTGFELANTGELPETALAIASGMAAASRHPLAKAVRAACPQAEVLHGVQETPGFGLSWMSDNGVWKLGSNAYLALPDRFEAGTWLCGPEGDPVRLSFRSTLRPGTTQAITSLRASGLPVQLLSGDEPREVAAVAAKSGIWSWEAAASPVAKAERMARAREDGANVLLVGDGINDAPAMAAATVSIAPADATDLSLRQADAVFMHRSLEAVPFALDLARASQRIVRQNIAFSFIYNAVWVPVAMLGLVTPWIAALAMSASSLIVTLNALRLHVVRLGSAAGTR